MMKRPEARSPEAESLRALRASILFRRLRNPFQTMLITSAGPQDGKSFVAANLAVGLAGAGLRVILVDCDLRRPSLHVLFDLPNAAGVAELLQYGEPLSDTMIADRIQETELGNLLLLPAGQAPLDPLPRLLSPSLSVLVGHLRDMADVVLVDVPPMLTVSDATVVASSCDVSLFVLANNLTTNRQLRLVSKHLELHPEFGLLGVVFNQVRLRGGDSYYYRARKARASGRVERLLARLGPLAKLVQPPGDGTERYVSLVDAADKLGITRQMARRWGRTERLPVVRSGLRYWVRQEDVQLLAGPHVGEMDSLGSRSGS